MDHYKIILDQGAFDAFIAGLPELEAGEAWYGCLFGRSKYDPTFPKSKDAGQLARFEARNRDELRDKVRRLEAPLGSYRRDGVVASQECLALYLAMNPRSLKKANKLLLVELAKRFADGDDTAFNPVSLSRTCIHNATGRRLVTDFDFDGVEPTQHIDAIRQELGGGGGFRILKTRGGFHLLVSLESVKDRAWSPRWHQGISKLQGCDVRGTDTLTPIPGCTQGGFCPRELHFPEATHGA